jgi:hypothetical protein
MMWPKVGILDTHTNTTHDNNVTTDNSNTKDVIMVTDVTTRRSASTPVNGNMPTSWTPSPSVARQDTDLQGDHLMTHHHQDSRRRGQAKTEQDRLRSPPARASPSTGQVNAIVLVVNTRTTSTQSPPQTLQGETPGHDAQEATIAMNDHDVEGKGEVAASLGAAPLPSSAFNGRRMAAAPTGQTASSTTQHAATTTQTWSHTPRLEHRTLRNAHAKISACTKTTLTTST